MSVTMLNRKATPRHECREEHERATRGTGLAEGMRFEVAERRGTAGRPANRMLGFSATENEAGAGERIRTVDIWLGKPVFCH